MDADDPRYVGGFGRFRHYSRPFIPANTDVVTPNNDTPCSWAWLDLRAEPWVVSVPAVDRYYVLPFRDDDTSYVGYVGYVGARTTGQDAGDHLLVGPGRRGTVPDGIAGVQRADTFLVGVLGRTCLADPDDVDALRAIQERYLLRPLSRYLHAPPRTRSRNRCGRSGAKRTWTASSSSPCWTSCSSSSRYSTASADCATGRPSASPATGSSNRRP
ncbi:DUF1254 domain-containing protein [Streptomyces sp. NPDC010273]|uniref:DUF1254 domain-containing protein n=1 Tax=Streptomyces sp. NPDC010273 TaxID=3364829 RepID=UPI0036EC9DE1